jgi:hypothetical protein
MLLSVLPNQDGGGRVPGARSLGPNLGIPVSISPCGISPGVSSLSIPFMATKILSRYRTSVRAKLVVLTLSAQVVIRHISFSSFPLERYLSPNTLFGSPATSNKRPLGFASPPRDGFALLAALLRKMHLRYFD